jgi:hypothetical protein
MKMEAAGFPETVLPVYQAILYLKAEDSNE